MNYERDVIVYLTSNIYYNLIVLAVRIIVSLWKRSENKWMKNKEVICLDFISALASTAVISFWVVSRCWPRERYRASVYGPVRWRNDGWILHCWSHGHTSSGTSSKQQAAVRQCDTLAIRHFRTFTVQLPACSHQMLIVSMTNYDNIIFSVIVEIVTMSQS